MDDDVRKRIENRYKMLRAFYKGSMADPMKYTINDDFERLAEAEEVALDDAVQAAKYLFREGLLSMRGPQSWGITHNGICEYEASLEQPGQSTEHFPAQIIYNLTIAGGTIGAVQAGSSNSARVEQASIRLDEFIKTLAELRQLLRSLPDDQRGEAERLLGAMEGSIVREQR